MGSLELICPLCCHEKFLSYKALKTHILTISQKLICPACRKTFDDLSTLADHLDGLCQEREEEIDAITAKPEQISKEKCNDVFNDDDEENGDNIKYDDMHEILQEETKQQEKEDKVDNIDETKPTSYFCIMCNLGFDAIDEHLEQHHEGEEVILEESTSEVSETVDKLSPIKTDHEYVLEIVDNEDSIGNQLDVGDQFVNEEHFVDNSGIAYTRKFVKVPEFWKNVPPSPIVEKNIPENSMTRKMHNPEESTSDSEIIKEILKCPKCSLQFPRLDLYSVHTCGGKKTNSDFKCMYCSAVFESFNTLEVHMKTHPVKENVQKKRVVTMEPYTCEVCGTIFPSFKSLRLHKKMHEPVKDRPIEAPVNYTISGVKKEKSNVRTMFICVICNNTYDKEYEIVHMKSHSNDENFDCSICNKKFHTFENLKMHTKAHKNEKKLMCSHCKKPFNSEDTLKDHVGKECGKRKYACQYCGRTFSRPYEKVKHERIHTGEKPHVCKICGKAFRVSYCLTLHLRTHTGLRPYECGHCGKRFKSHGVYSHHIQVHSEVRAYKCPYCPKSFKTGVQLAGHKNTHTKPFTCTYCNRPFASLYAVRAHMETHQSENNLKFTCWLCGASYGRAFALGDHIKSQHTQDNMDIDENMFVELEAPESQLEQDIENEDGEKMAV